MSDTPTTPNEDVTKERFRPRRRAALYARLFVLAALMIVLVALVVANAPRTVELSWVFGSGRVSVVWVILLSAILGWLVGIVTGAVVQFSSRRRD